MDKARGLLVALRRSLPAFILFPLLGLLIAWVQPDPPPVPMTVIWRGQNFQVDARNPDYSPEQAARIEAMLRSASPPAEALRYEDLIAWLATMSVPGYGESTGGFGDVTPWGRFTFLSVEIPRGELHRVLVYRTASPGAPYRLFDDFIISGVYPPVLTFVPSGGELLYREDGTRRIVRSRPFHRS